MCLSSKEGSEHRSITMSGTSLESIRSHQYDTDFQLLYPKKIGSPKTPTMATIVVVTRSNSNGVKQAYQYVKWPITAIRTSLHARERKLGFFFRCLHYAVGEFAFFHSWIQQGERNGFAKGTNNLSSQYFLLSNWQRERWFCSALKAACKLEILFASKIGHGDWSESAGEKRKIFVWWIIWQQWLLEKTILMPIWSK